MSLKANDLGDLQLAVMRALWTLDGGGTVYDVRDAVSRDPAPAYTTVLTVLRSLEKRGLVEHYSPPHERQHRYRPLVTDVEAEKSLLADILERVFDGAADRMLSRLIETGCVGMPGLAAMRCLLEKTLESRDPSPIPRNGASETPSNGNGNKEACASDTDEAGGTDLHAWRRRISRQLR